MLKMHEGRITLPFFQSFSLEYWNIQAKQSTSSQTLRFPWQPLQTSMVENIYHPLFNYRCKILPKPADLQDYDFNTDVTEELSKETLSTGYHDNGPFLKLLMYQKFIRGLRSMFVPSFMVVSKSARF